MNFTRPFIMFLSAETLEPPSRRAAGAAGAAEPPEPPEPPRRRKREKLTKETRAAGAMAGREPGPRTIRRDIGCDIGHDIGHDRLLSVVMREMLFLTDRNEAEKALLSVGF